MNLSVHQTIPAVPRARDRSFVFASPRSLCSIPFTLADQPGRSLRAVAWRCRRWPTPGECSGGRD